ncbi:hypothetical protein BDF19DRAFT_420517 [Syncephalis fuscata]|nr:hypothetical protein BDF19DRAFT_420517 [Syncephalis fuscata]
MSQLTLLARRAAICSRPNSIYTSHIRIKNSLWSSWQLTPPTHTTLVYGYANPVIKSTSCNIINRTYTTLNIRQHLSNRILALQHSKQSSLGYFISTSKQLGRRNYTRYASSHHRNLSHLVTPALISLNIIIYATWVYAKWDQEAHPNSRSTLMKFMQQNFLCSSNYVLQDNRWWTLLTASFSHSELWHMGLNMFALHSLGSSPYLTVPFYQLATVIGTRRFLAIYLISGITGSLTSIMYNRWRENQIVAKSHLPRSLLPMNATHGASGVATVYTLLFPSTRFLLFFVIPMPGWLMMTALVGWDGFSLLSNKPSVFDHAGHLGGVAGGLGTTALLMTRLFARR